MIETAGFRIVEWLSNPVATPGSGSKAGELVRHMDIAIMVGTRNYEEGRITQAWYVAGRA